MICRLRRNLKILDFALSFLLELLLESFSWISVEFPIEFQVCFHANRERVRAHEF